MYPLCNWTYQELCQRLDLLLEYDLRHEAVVACAQTVEQTVRRVLKQYMTVHQKAFIPVKQADGKHRWQLVELESKDARDQYLRQLQSLHPIKRSWAKTVALHDVPKLPALIDRVCGTNTWRFLTTDNSVLLTGEIVKCRMGFFPLRHKIVHAVHAPPEHDLEVMSKFGVRVVKDLWHPDFGISQQVRWNPQKRISRWKTVN